MDETVAVDLILGIMDKIEVLPSIEVLRLGGSYELVYQLCRSILCLLSESTWMLRGHATRSSLVFPFETYFLRSVCAFSVLRASVHHSQQDVPSDFASLHQLGKITQELQRGVPRPTFFAPGIATSFGEFLWQRWIFTVSILIRKF